MRLNPLHCAHTLRYTHRVIHTHKQCLHLDYTPPLETHSTFLHQTPCIPVLPRRGSDRLSPSLSLFLSFSLGLSLSCHFLLLSLNEKCVRLRSRRGGDKQLVKQQWSVLSARVMWFTVNVCVIKMAATTVNRKKNTQALYQNLASCLSVYCLHWHLCLTNLKRSRLDIQQTIDFSVFDSVWC